MAQPGATTGPELLAFLGERDAAELCARGRRLPFPAGVTLLHQHEDADRVILLLEGRVKLSCTLEGGRSLVVGFRGPGELVGALPVLGERPRRATVTAVDGIDAVVVPAHAFLAFLEEAPGASTAMLRWLACRAGALEEEQLAFAAADAIGRVAARLVELADRFGEPAPGGLEIALSLSQEELASWCGCSREAVVKALHTLRELEWISTSRRRVTVHDLDALRGRAP